MNPETKSIVQNFRITPSFQSRLASVAAKQGKSVSVFVRESVEARMPAAPKLQWSGAH